ncbi:MAG: acyl carrier protein [Roseibium album]|uniref:acyl carrier protein n=1 Tax=Roseibium album TaxID=311410 RepID=UPI0032F020D3
MFDEVRSVLSEALQLGSRGANFTASTPLLGSIVELDSMAVVTVLTMLEERFGFSIDDDEISAETFATVGTLTMFVEQKLSA